MPRRKFQAADSDKDGFLGLEELKGNLFPEHHEALRQLEAEAHMGRKDADKDGSLSRSEFVREGPEDTLDERQLCASLE